MECTKRERGTVLVTGGTRRIGRAIADELLSRGWKVLIHSRVGSGFFSADLADSSEVETLFSRACEQAPDLCAIVNNASIFSTAQVLPPEAVERLLQVNVHTPMRLTDLLGRYLMTRGSVGGVVNLLDTRVVGTSASGDTPYARSKRSLLMATGAQARTWAPTLRVNGVAPGPVLPPSDVANHEKGGDILLARRPTVADVASAVAYLLEAEAVTGQVLAVDAGQNLLAHADATSSWVG